jgi:hypothetical protein
MHIYININVQYICIYIYIHIYINILYSTKQRKNPVAAKSRQFVRQMSVSHASDHFLSELKDVASCMLITKNVNKIKTNLF